MNKNEFETIILSDSLFSAESKTKLLSVDSAVAVMDGFLQRNPHHCYDLFEHTLHTVASINCEELDADEIRLLKTAALFHDIGKPNCAIEKPGKLVFYGHPKESAKLAAPLLSELGYSEEDAARILFYIKNHDMFISFVLPEEDYDRGNPYLKEINEDNVSEAMKLVAQKEKTIALNKHDFLLLLRLCKADAMAQSELVYGPDGEVIDSRAHKLAKFREIEKIIKQL